MAVGVCVIGGVGVGSAVGVVFAVWYGKFVVWFVYCVVDCWVVFDALVWGCSCCMVCGGGFGVVV